MLSRLTSHPSRGLASLVAALVLASGCVMGGGSSGGGSGGGSGAGQPGGEGSPCPASSARASTAPTATAAAPTGSSQPGGSSGGASCPNEQTGVTYNEHAGGGGGKNIVILQNRQDGRLTVRGAIQLNRIPGPTVEPVNTAIAYGECTDCQTLAVALQINLISRDANVVEPQNAAIAANFNCTRCVTVARALQYTYSVDDPTQVPAEVRDLLHAMEQELRRVSAERDITLDEAEQRINAIIADFRELAESLNDQRDEATESDSPTPSPVPGATDSEAPSATPAPSATLPSDTADPTDSPTTEQSPSPTATP